MKTKKMSAILVLVLALVVCGERWARAGEVVAWGYNDDGQCNVPSPTEDFIAIASGHSHSLGLKADGSVAAWGYNILGQCDVPSPNEGFVAVAGGNWYSLGLKADGSIAAWGSDGAGQCQVPYPNADFVAVAAGGYHGLGLKADGSIAAWGGNLDGQCNVPLPNADFIAVAAGGYHSLGLKADGSVVAWGLNDDAQCTVPLPNADFIVVAGGGAHSLGLKADGSIVTWGRNNYGQCDVPLPNAGFIAVAGGGNHSLGLKADGSIVGWGLNNYGRCDVPLPNKGFIAVAAGGYHSLGLKAESTESMRTAFTYQGRLIDANDAADGPYDFEFRLFDGDGVQWGNTVKTEDLEVIDGYFTVQLDFGRDVFDGFARWLEVGVRPGELEDPNEYTTLSPRQEVTPTPYARTAENVAGGVPWRSPGWLILNAAAGRQGYFPPGAAVAGYPIRKYRMPFDVTIEGVVISADDGAGQSYSVGLYVNQDSAADATSVASTIDNDDTVIQAFPSAVNVSAGSWITLKCVTAGSQSELLVWFYGRTNE